MLRTSDLDYVLPPDRIAVEPVTPRDAARLMVVPRDGAGSGAGEARSEAAIQHRHVRDLREFLRAGDLLVLNATRVVPARFRGHREDSGGGAEGLYLGEASVERGMPRPRWSVLIKARRQSPGVRFVLHDHAGGDSGVTLTLIERDPANDAAWIANVSAGGGEPGMAAPSTPAILDRLGLTPLPPYILHARRDRHLEVDDSRDRESYQTVFAHPNAEESRPTASVAAPTAGLHFTPELLAALQRHGVEIARVNLHVGVGTFKPVEAEFVEQHTMHAEWCEIPAAEASRIRAARAAGRRIIAVGTTSARTLETFADELTVVPPASGGAGGASLSRATIILITPGYRWKVCDGLMTNFHLPRSTLMAMVAALLEPGGVARLQSLYAEALAHGYRFYSYGDAMLMV